MAVVSGVLGASEDGNVKIVADPTALNLSCSLMCTLYLHVLIFNRCKT